MKRDQERVIVAGFGGQGVMLIGQILSYAATNEDINTVWIPSYGPETRGGTANCSVTISKPLIDSPIITRPDSVIALNKPSLLKFESKLKANGVLIVNNASLAEHKYREDITVIKVDANKEALAIGNLKVANMVMLGAYIEATHVFDKEAIVTVFKKIFTGNKAKLIDLNIKALDRGIEIVQQA